MEAAVFVTWLVSVLLMITLFGVVIRRLLGVRIGAVRTLAAALLALVGPGRASLDALLARRRRRA